MTRYTSPVNPAVFPHLTVVLLAIGMFFTAWFFVYPSLLVHASMPNQQKPRRENTFSKHSPSMTEILKPKLEMPEHSVVLCVEEGSNPSRCALCLCELTLN